MGLGFMGPLGSFGQVTEDLSISRKLRFPMDWSSTVTEFENAPYRCGEREKQFPTGVDKQSLENIERVLPRQGRRGEATSQHETVSPESNFSSSPPPFVLSRCVVLHANVYEYR